MNIVVANQKGGVGKTTICILLANYFAYLQKKETVCIDFDPQGSLYYKYKEDESIYSDKLGYPVIKKDLNQSRPLLQRLADSDNNGIVIIDTPGSFDNDNVIPIFQSADLIICPFSYEQTTFESTYVFVKVIKRLNIKADIIFIPNRLKTNVKYSLIESVNKILEQFGTITSEIDDLITFQRLSLSKYEDGHLIKTCKIFDNIYTKYVK